MPPRLFGSNRDLANSRVPFALYSRYAWEGLERSGPFPIVPAYRATLLYFYVAKRSAIFVLPYVYIIFAKKSEGGYWQLSLKG